MKGCGFGNYYENIEKELSKFIFDYNPSRSGVIAKISEIRFNLLQNHPSFRTNNSWVTSGANEYLDAIANTRSSY